MYEITIWHYAEWPVNTECFLGWIYKQTIFCIYFTSTMVRFRYFIKQQLPPVRREVVKTWLYKLGRLWMSSANLTLTNSSVGTRRANVSYIIYDSIWDLTYTRTSISNDDIVKLTFQLDMYQPATSTQSKLLRKFFFSIVLSVCECAKLIFLLFFSVMRSMMTLEMVRGKFINMKIKWKLKMLILLLDGM